MISFTKIDITESNEIKNLSYFTSELVNKIRY